MALYIRQILIAYKLFFLTYFIFAMAFPPRTEATIIADHTVAGPVRHNTAVLDK